MPRGPGVYIFKGGSGRILYIGKANSLRQRVGFYFQSAVRLGPKTSALVSQIKAIDHIPVTCEPEALLLESKLIRKFLPPYNAAARDDKSPYYIHLSRERFPKPVISHKSEGSVAGPFLNRVVPFRILRWLRRIAPFCTAVRPVIRPCLHSHLGLCNPCPATGKVLLYQKNINRLKRLLKGEFKSVLGDLSKKMRGAVKKQDFETAALLRDQMNSLELLMKPPISPEEYIVNPNLAEDLRRESLDRLRAALSIKSPLSRIEFFDNAHLAGSAPTSAMTVAIDGELKPSLYRHFTLKSGGDDVAMMKEVLGRRLKNRDWPVPDLIVLDGGRAQLSVVDWGITTVALAKAQEVIYSSDGNEIGLPRTNSGLQLLQKLRDEAHRFSRRLHHKHRRQEVLK